jgi:hypothetical protein
MWWVFTNVSEKPVASMFRIEDKGSMFLQNIGEFLPGYTVSIEGLFAFHGLFRQMPGYYLD